MNGRFAIDPKHISKIRWDEDMRARFEVCYKASGMSLRKIGDSANVAHSFVNKLRKGAEGGADFDADYELVSRVLAAIGVKEYELFDCFYASINTRVINT